MAYSLFSRPAAPQRSFAAIPRCVAVSNLKGGVGKTSTTANVAGEVARQGLKVLLIDMDPQGNLNREFGYEKLPEFGEDLAKAIQDGAPLPITENVRPNLDVVKSSRALQMLHGVVYGLGGESHILPGLLYKSLSAVADPYDLILIDTSPGERWLQRAILAVSSAMLIPLAPDEASIDGLDETAELFVEVTADDVNPDVELLGVLLFGVSAETTRKILREIREQIELKLGGVAPVFNGTIRTQLNTSVAARRQGLLVRELAEQTSDKRVRYRMEGLSNDYEQITNELMKRILEIESEESAGVEQ